MTEITSSTNIVFKKFLSLTESKGLKREALFLLSGKDLVSEFLKNPSLKIDAEIQAPGKKAMSSAKAFSFSKDLYEKLDVLGTKENILVLSQPEIPEWKPTPSSSASAGLTVLLPLGDPGNLGALLRSCEAFGASAVVLLSEAANPFLPKSVKASAGSILRLNLFRGPSIQKLNELKIKDLIALDMKGTPLSSFTWPKNPKLLVGEEGPGVPPSILKTAHKIKIETEGVESLNATVATSIALYAFSLS
jgi:TrmH family RNA methyltransferase